MIVPASLSPHLAARAEISGVKELFEPQEISVALETILQAQRVYLMKTLGVEDHPLVSELFEKDLLPRWADFVEVETSDANKQRLADMLLEGDPQRRVPILLKIADYSRGIAEKIVERCVREKFPVDIWIDDPVFKRRLLIVGGEAMAKRYGELMAKQQEAVQRIVGFSMSTPSFAFPDEKPEELEKIFDKAQGINNLFYTATRMPTIPMAEADGMTYPELLEIYFDMINVDMDQVGLAHRVLIDKLNAAEDIHFMNDDGTDLRMSIKGFTFVNSLTAKNVPGSEVFSAPVRDSVNGRLVAKGKFIHPQLGGLIENITLIFEHGRVIACDADRGLDLLHSYLDTDEGMRYLGEVALGTNPALRRHVTNSLMVEKVGLSFHVALGKAYQYTDYIGVPVVVDNGNRSTMHWDITTMLYGKNGRIVLDGEVLMEGGFYCDPRLSYLNGAR